jgi:DNA-binding transcriptional regulator LsrR (DeoR family)
MRKAKLANTDVRAEMKHAGVTQWQIADEMGVCEMTITRKLWHKMDITEKAKMFTLIERLRERTSV